MSPSRVARVATAPVRTGGPAAQLGQVLRDRFRIAGGPARPFQFQQVAAAPTDLHCLAEAVYFEARGEVPAGQQAVAQVVLNRVRHPAFPKTICAVVHQRTGSSCQFAFACSSRQAAVNSVAWRRAETVASSEMHGAVMSAVGDATHFQTARSGALAGLLRVAQIGAHVFYRFGGHAGAAAMFSQTPGPSAQPARTEAAKIEVAMAESPPSPKPGLAPTPNPASPPQIAAQSSTRPVVTAVKLVTTPASLEAKPAPQATIPVAPANPAAAPTGRIVEAPPAKLVSALALAQS